MDAACAANPYYTSADEDTALRPFGATFEKASEGTPGLSSGRRGRIVGSMRRYTWLLALGPATVVAIASCSAAPRAGSGVANVGGAGGGVTAGGAGNAGNAGNTGGALNFLDASTGSGGVDGGSSSSCPPNAQMVYVTGEPAELWSFWPPTFTFTKIGDVTCTSPTHMTVD